MKANKTETSIKTEDCWQYFNCPSETRKNCFVYLFELSHNCWKYSNIKNKNCPCNSSLNEIEQNKKGICDHCEFYKLRNKF